MTIEIGLLLVIVLSQWPWQTVGVLQHKDVASEAIRLIQSSAGVHGCSWTLQTSGFIWLVKLEQSTSTDSLYTHTDRVSNALSVMPVLQLSTNVLAKTFYLSCNTGINLSLFNEKITQTRTAHEPRLPTCSDSKLRATQSKTSSQRSSTKDHIAAYRAVIDDSRWSLLLRTPQQDSHVFKSATQLSQMPFSVEGSRPHLIHGSLSQRE